MCLLTICHFPARLTCLEQRRLHRPRRLSEGKIRRHPPDPTRLAFVRFDSKGRVGLRVRKWNGLQGIEMMNGVVLIWGMI